MELNGLQADTLRPLCGGGECFPHALKTLAIECDWRVFARRERNGGWSDRLPAVRRVRRNLRAPVPGNLGRRLASGMGELNRDRDVRIAADALQRAGDRSLRPAPSDQRPTSPWVMRPSGSTAVASIVGNAAPQRQMTEMNEMPIGHAAVDGRVLAHRSDHDPIGKGDTSYFELREKLGHDFTSASQRCPIVNRENRPII